ncbi:hypothetical protein BH11PSE9_BH11PSE9_28550 [soil metagenome]
MSGVPEPLISPMLSMPKCPRCKSSNPPAARFCNECGAAQPAVLPESGDLFELDVGGADAAPLPQSSAPPVAAEGKAAPPPVAVPEPRPFSVHFERDGSVLLTVSHAAEAVSAPLGGDPTLVQVPHPAEHASDPMIAPAPPVIARDAAPWPPVREPGMVASAWHEPEPEMPGHLHRPRHSRRAAPWAGAAIVALMACAAGWWGLRPSSAPISASAQPVPRAITTDPASASSHVAAASAVLPLVPVGGMASTMTVQAPVPAPVPGPMALAPAALIDSAPTAAGSTAPLVLAAKNPAISSPAVPPVARSSKARKASHKARATVAGDSERVAARTHKKAVAAAISSSGKTKTVGAKATAAETRAAASKARRASATPSAAKLGRPATVSASSKPTARVKKAKAPKKSQRRAVKPSILPAPVPSRPA